MTKQTILYLFDPLCGWCYSVSGGMAKLAETADVKLVPTGLFSRDKIMSPDWSERGSPACPLAKPTAAKFCSNPPTSIPSRWCRP